MTALFKRKIIDWEKTGKNLQLLRIDNISLRRCVCNALSDKERCSGRCDECKFEMDTSISRTELAEVFCVSESVVFNWENGKTPVPVEELLFYCQLADVELEDVLVYRDK